MANDEFDNPFKLKSVPGPAKKKRAGGSGAVFVAVAVAALVGLGYLVWDLRPGAGGNTPETPRATSPQTDTDRAAVAFCEQFMLYYYNYSYNMHSAAVARAKTMMTAEMAQDYNSAALDSDFTSVLSQYRVSTSAVKIDPGSVLLNNSGNTYNVYLTGSIVYTTLSNNASGQLPMTIVIQLKKTPAGFLVDNIQRLK